MRFAFVTALASFLLFTSRASAAEKPQAFDELPHKSMELPNGSRMELVQFNEQWYRLVLVDDLATLSLADPAVCFVAQIKAVEISNRIQIIGSAVELNATEGGPQRAVKELKAGDNIACFGTLHKEKDGKAIDVLVAALLKQPSDLVRYQNAFTAIECKAKSAGLNNDDKEAIAKNLLNLGQRISHAPKAALMTEDAGATLNMLATKSFKLSLELTEQVIRSAHPKDADRYFGLAFQYHELLPENKSKYETLIRTCLILDPDHSVASKIAEEKFHWVKFETVWMTPERKAEILNERGASQHKIDNMRTERVLALHKRIASERLIFSNIAADLANADGEVSAKALTLAKDIFTDAPEVGPQLISAVTEVDTPIALAALAFAAQCKSPELRVLGFEALAWRSKRTNEEALAVSTLCDDIRAEKEVEIAQSGVSALVARGGKPAQRALVACLDVSDKDVRASIVEGLRELTHESYTTRDEWESWLKKN
jgi:hypothetical protein